MVLCKPQVEHFTTSNPLIYFIKTFPLRLPGREVSNAAPTAADNSGDVEEEQEGEASVAEAKVTKFANDSVLKLASVRLGSLHAAFLSVSTSGSSAPWVAQCSPRFFFQPQTPIHFFVSSGT